MQRLQLTADMLAAIEMTAKHFNCTPESVLRRMVFSYAAKFEEPAVNPDTANVIALRRDGQ